MVDVEDEDEEEEEEEGRRAKDVAVDARTKMACRQG